MGCCRWTLPSVPKGWYLCTSYWRRGFSFFLLAQILSSFPTVQSVVQGVPQGRRAPSSLLRSLRGRSRWSLRSWGKYVQHGECRHFYETCQLFHQWLQEDGFHHRDDILLQCSVHGGVLAKQCLVFSGIFSYERLFLGAPHDLMLVAWVVRRHKRESCLFRLLLGRHWQREESVSDSSEVWCHGRHIPTDQLMEIYQSFSCCFSVNLQKDRRQEFRKDSLGTARCPRRFVSTSCWDWCQVRRLR